MKTVLFVPGSGEDMNSRDYAATIQAIENKGYKVRFVDIQWSRRTIEQWVSEFNLVYAEYDPKDTILAGFSFGAMIAYMAAVERNPSQLWLFSLSPYFIEDIESSGMKQSWLNNIGHRREAAFRKLRFADLQKKINSKTLFFYGDLELPKWPDISYRELPIEKSTDAVIKIAKAVGHDVAHENYIQAIVENI